MLAHGLGEGAEDYTLVCQRFAVGSRNAYRVKHRIDRNRAAALPGLAVGHKPVRGARCRAIPGVRARIACSRGLDTRQDLPFVQGNPQFVKGLHQRGVDLGRPLAVLLGCSPIDNILIINLRQLEVAPVGFLHHLPFPESVQPELQQPVRLALLFGNHPYYVLVQPLGNIFLLYVSDKSFLIFLRGEFL